MGNEPCIQVQAKTPKTGFHSVMVDDSKMASVDIGSASIISCTAAASVASKMSNAEAGASPT